MATMREEGHQLQLTDLPDDILIRILSNLSTQSAVTICLGVKGLQHLWKYLTRIKFDYTDSMDLVEKVMDLRDHCVPLESLSLYFSDPNMDGDEAYRILTWLPKVFPCNVEELALSMDDTFNKYTMLNHREYYSIFQCQSLVKLDLKSITVDSLFISLPHLKYLRLGFVRLENARSTEELLSSPLLEKLVIDYCYWHGQSIRVCPPKLQVLNISDREKDNKAKICIIGDNLKHFYYIGNLIKEYQICASSSTQLNKVEIYVDEEMRAYFGPNCYKILKGLSQTKNLALSDYFLKGIQNDPHLLDTIPTFNFLTRLDIRVYKKVTCIDSSALMKIYERCPHLECLNIGKLRSTKKNRLLSPIPSCFQTSLKKILVHYYIHGDNRADAAIDVLLKSAHVLEELIIYCERDKDKGYHEGSSKIRKLRKRLNQRPRISKDCIISVRVTFDANDMQELRHDEYYDNCYLNSMNEC